MSSTAEVPLVLVSGISGYIASWVGYTALKLGYRVRGTVRSLKNEAKVAHLRDLCPGSAHKIELVEADLSSEQGWAEAVAGCTYVLHVASPFPLVPPKNKDELIRPAVDGTLYVLTACARAVPKPKRVVVTSSVVSVAYGQASSADKPFTEENWTVTDDPRHPIDAYTESKVLAERAAWDFVNALPEADRFELATVNPGFVQGPLLSGNSCSSADLPRQILMGEMPALADLPMPICHIFDVAKAHLLAMTKEEAAGKRFMVCSGTMSIVQYGKLLREEFRSQGYSPTSMVAPKWLLGVLSWVDKQAKAIYPDVGKKLFVAPQNAKAVLGLEVHADMAEIVKEMAYGAIASGLIPDKSPEKRITSSYTRPEIDLSGLPSP